MKPAPWMWIVVIVLLGVVNFFVWGTGVGVCTDFSADMRAISTCTESPSVGFAGAWTISAISIIFAVYGAYRLLRRERP